VRIQVCTGRTAALLNVRVRSTACFSSTDVLRLGFGRVRLRTSWAAVDKPQEVI